MDFKKITVTVYHALTTARVVGVVLIALGLWTLVFDNNFSVYSSHEAQWRGIDMSFKDTLTIYIPTWASVGMIVLGGLLVLIRRNP